MVLGFLWMRDYDARDREFGVTFSDLYATSLGLDWKNAYTSMLDELDVVHIRIPVYWSEVEQTPGVYDFSDLDWMMNEAKDRGAQVTLAIGQKVPRWPECYIPSQYGEIDADTRNVALLAYLEAVVTRYKDHNALSRWQVENEPFFPFGICPPPDASLVVKEIELVRRLDPDHDIQLTTSGEQSIWVTTAIPADVLGVSLYRIVYNDYTGYLGVPLQPFFYRVQRWISSPFARHIIISELQAEPWNAYLYVSTDPDVLDRGYRVFTEKNLQDHVEFARRSGMDEIYLWGVEWWYYLKTMGNDKLWVAAKEIF